MKMKKKRMLISQILVWILFVTGCGTKGPTEDELFEEMKKFSFFEATSLYLNQDWQEQETASEQIFKAGSPDGSDAVFVYQIPKGTDETITSLDDMKTQIQELFQCSQEKPLKEFAIAGMSNVSASRWKASQGGFQVDVCLAYGETDYAFYSIGYLTGSWKKSMLASFQLSCKNFIEFDENPAVSEKKEKTSDTVRWFNAAYAIATRNNGGDPHYIGGFLPEENTKKEQLAFLEKWWEVTDRASAEATLNWILTEGHRTGFASDMACLEEAGMGTAPDRKQFYLQNFVGTEAQAEHYVSWYEMYEQYGEDAILGWDYCRALNLIGLYYLAGYYSEQEALDRSLPIAQTAQGCFASWDDLIESYLRGYEYWSEKSSSDRRVLYEEMKNQADSPYGIDFNLTLEKTW